jgi:glycosyltransferase involved in cell wall biosynthesis
VAERSTTHLVLIPSYNPGESVFATVRAARAQWEPVWVVTDGSSDGTPARLREMAAADPGLRVVELPRNAGKGNAVLQGVALAAREGFTHALTMDSDGQHPAELIPRFMHASMEKPGALVLGVPVFDASAPSIRVKGRKISNWWANLETFGGGIGDSAFGCIRSPTWSR